MSRLEQRYRSVLRLLPGAYREAWEEEMVATFLESVATDDAERADYLADFGRPSWSEVASVAALALRLRLGEVRLRLGEAGAPPAWVAWGEAVRLAALAGLLTNAVLAAVMVGFRLWLAGRIAWLPAPPADWAQGLPSTLGRALWEFAGLAWVLAFVTLLVGQYRLARLFALLAMVPAAATAVSATVDLTRGAQPFAVTVWADLLLDALLLLALTAFHRDAPPPRRLPWLAAFAVGVVAVPGLLLLDAARQQRGMLPLLDWPGLCSLAVVTAAVLHLAGPVLRGARRAPSWTHALALLATAVLGLRLVTLLDYLLFAPGRQLVALAALGVAEAAAVLAAGVPLARLATRELRRLAPAPAAPTR